MATPMIWNRWVRTLFAVRQTRASRSCKGRVGRPEIQQDGFASQVGEFDIFAVNRGQFEIGREIADKLSLGEPPSPQFCGSSERRQRAWPLQGRR